MGRSENVMVFNHTKSIYENTPELRDAIKQSILDQKLFFEDLPLPQAPQRYETEASVIVSGKRTLQAASKYKGKKTCVLNFASATNPGGGVEKGSSAQEEALCRCSTLFPCLMNDLQTKRNGFYAEHRANKDPLHNDDCIYTPNVIAFKSDEAYPKMLPPSWWYPVNVITCAAPNLRVNPRNQWNQDEADFTAVIEDSELKKLHEKRLRRILDIAAAYQNDVVILGAFGCGAFRNPPEIVAEAAAEVIKEYIHCFQTIEFAIYCADRAQTNYSVFQDALK